MLKKLNKSNQGFTIIEVLIVLAIAALILLIVFLAVPALQRNSRNTQRKNDVAAVLGAMNEYSNNANGAAITCGAAGNYDDALDNAQLGYYDAADVTCDAAKTTNDVDIAAAVVVPGAACDGADAVSASSRQVAVLYNVEAGSGGDQPSCQDQ